MRKTIFSFVWFLLFPALSFSQTSYGSDLAATVAFPIGTNSVYYKTGIGGIAGFYYEMETSWRVGLTIGFIRMGLNENEISNRFVEIGQEGFIDVEGPVSIIPILLSAKFIFPGPSTRIYAIIEGGLYTYWTNINGSINYTGENPGVVPFDKSEFSSEIGWNLGLGALFPLNEEVSIDASVRYHFVRDSETVDFNYVTWEENVGSSHFLNIALGASWNFKL